MSTTHDIEEISPAHHGAETRGVSMVAAAILALWTVGLIVRRVAPVPVTLASHQRSAFSALDPREQGMFNDLRAASAEIAAWRIGRPAWPAPSELAAEAIPPFAEDAVWAQRGRHAWQLLDAHSSGHVVYWGRSVETEWALVLMGSATAIWRREAKVGAPIPQAIPGLLVLDGWQEFIAREVGAKP